MSTTKKSRRLTRANRVDITQEFIDTVRQAIEDQEATMAEVASAAGMQPPGLSRMLSGTEKPSIERANAVLNALGKKIAFVEK